MEHFLLLQYVARATSAWRVSEALWVMAAFHTFTFMVVLSCLAIWYSVGVCTWRVGESETSFLIQGLSTKGTHIQGTTPKKSHPYLDLM